MIFLARQLIIYIIAMRTSRPRLIVLERQKYMHLHRKFLLLTFMSSKYMT